MSDYSSLALRNLIDENLITTAEKRMCNLLDLSIVTVDTDGNVLGEKINSNSFCELICSSENGKTFYKQWNLILNEKVLKDRMCRVYEGKMGLKSCIAPIIAEGILVGSVIIGHFFTEGEEYKKDKFDIKGLSVELSLPEDKIQQAVLKLPVASEKCVLKYMECCEVLSDYFTEVARKNIAEQKLLQQVQENIRFKDEVEKAEIKTLGAQINPHFLFNTLNSITRMALLEDSPRTEEMIYCLSDLLRYSIKQNEEFPTIQSELENVKKYLFIQCIRYKDRLKYSIDVPNELLSFRIPSMILQPLVENAIIHGLEPKIEGGDIRISCEFENDNIKILIKDTGIGIPEKKIVNLLNDDTKTCRGLGVYSSHQRLRTYFGCDYGLKIYSNKNIETTVEINLPCFKEITPVHKNLTM